MKRGFLISCAVASSLFFANGAQAGTVIFAHGYAPSHSLVTEWMEPWMECVKRETNGSVEFNYFPSGQIATVPTALGALNDGLVDVSVVAVGSNSDRFPLNGVTMLPGMGDTAHQMVQAYRGMLDAGSPLIREFHDSRIFPLSVNMTPVYQIMWRGKRVDTLDAMSGKLVRSLEGAMSFAVGAIGAAPVEMPPADIYIALERGSIDGVLLAPLSVPPYHLNEVLGSISKNASFGSSAAVLTISEKARQTLSEQENEAMDRCGKTIEIEFAKFFDRQNDELLAKFAEKGIDVYEFSPQVRDEMNERLKRVPNEFITRVSGLGRPAQETYDDYIQELKNIRSLQ
ncbi:TRAP transporter substrate-binding protein [Ochrobactrum teleogrylli]